MRKFRHLCSGCSYADSQDKRVPEFLVYTGPVYLDPSVFGHQASLTMPSMSISESVVSFITSLTTIHLEAPYLCLYGGGISAWVDDIEAPTVIVRSDGQETFPVESLMAAFIQSEPYKRWRVIPRESPCFDCMEQMTGERLKVPRPITQEIHSVYPRIQCSFYAHEDVGIDWASGNPRSASTTFRVNKNRTVGVCSHFQLSPERAKLIPPVYKIC